MQNYNFKNLNPYGEYSYKRWNFISGIEFGYENRLIPGIQTIQKNY